MKIRIKPLKGKEFYLNDVAPSQTIGEIKKMIQDQEGATFPAESLKVILLGKVLKDDRTLESFKFDENKNYLVLVVGKKKKPKPKPQETPAPPVTTTEVPATQTPAGNGNAPVAAEGAPVQPRTGAPPAQGPVITDAAVQNLVAMGFVASDARAALEAAFGNPQVAVEFLMNPEVMQQAIQRNQEIQNPPAATTTDTANLTPMQQFQRSPDFQRIRELVNTNPGAMADVLRDLQTSYPALFQEVSQNRESMNQFIELLSGEDEGGADNGSANPFGEVAAGGAPGGMGGLPPGLGAGGAPDMNQVMQMLQLMRQLPPEQRNALLQRFGIPPEALGPLMQGLAGAAAGGQGGVPRPPRATIQLTEEEHAAIGRLQELGFTRRACIEAYLACDKNEMLAANFLFNNPPEEDAGPPPPPATNNNNNTNAEGEI